MFRFLQEVANQVNTTPNAIAFENSRGESITYAQLWLMSDALAHHIAEANRNNLPVVVYGHKSPLMLASFFGCMKAGCAYAPIDTVYPKQRVDDIISQLGQVLVLNTFDEDDARFTGCEAVTGAFELSRIATYDDEKAVEAEMAYPPSSAISGNDIMYILFTSGSTGKPKGVQMPASCMDAFMDYFIGLMDLDGDAKQDPAVLFNRVPYTFDVSLFDMIPGLASGSHLYALETEAEHSMKATFEALSASSMTHWVSTPSFIEACLADPSFNQSLLPSLESIVLCGEVLRNSTSRSIVERFPRAKLYNTYGPTETQSVSDIAVDNALLDECDPLPVGYLSPGMQAIIRDPESGEDLPLGQIGEIFLAGDTVSLGYWNMPERTSAAFSQLEYEGKTLRCYRTGDKGFIDEKGRLFCLGRLDFQVKINGFRVELGDIEENLCALPAIKQACVVPVMREGAVAHLCAFVQLSDANAPKDFSQTRALKAACKAVVPEYMIPRAFRYLDEFPTNANGKIDRKELAARAAQPSKSKA